MLRLWQCLCQSRSTRGRKVKRAVVFLVVALVIALSISACGDSEQAATTLATGSSDSTITGAATPIIVNPAINKDTALAVQNDLAKVGIMVKLDYPNSAKCRSSCMGSGK
jgi:hypothetical protein